MTEVQKQIAKGTARVEEIGYEIAECEAQARAHEHEAREHRKKMDALKKERQELTLALGHQRVVDATQQAEAAAKASQVEAAKAKEEADATLQRLSEKEKQLDELIAKAAEAAKEPKEETKAE